MQKHAGRVQAQHSSSIPNIGGAGLLTPALMAEFSAEVSPLTLRLVGSVHSASSAVHKQLKPLEMISFPLASHFSYNCSVNFPEHTYYANSSLIFW